MLKIKVGKWAKWAFWTIFLDGWPKNASKSLSVLAFNFVHLSKTHFQIHKSWAKMGKILDGIQKKKAPFFGHLPLFESCIYRVKGHL